MNLLFLAACAVAAAAPATPPPFNAYTHEFSPYVYKGVLYRHGISVQGLCEDGGEHGNPRITNIVTVLVAEWCAGCKALAGAVGARGSGVLEVDKARHGTGPVSSRYPNSFFLIQYGQTEKMNPSHVQTPVEKREPTLRAFSRYYAIDAVKNAAVAGDWRMDAMPFGPTHIPYVRVVRCGAGSRGISHRTTDDAAAQYDVLWDGPIEYEIKFEALMYWLHNADVSSLEEAERRIREANAPLAEENRRRAEQEFGTRFVSDEM